MKVSKSVLKKLHEKLHALGVYHKAIPLGSIFEICKEAGLVPVQEDGSPWSGFLCGREGRASIELAGSRKWLQVQWYKMESGNYEVNAYVA